MQVTATSADGSSRSQLILSRIDDGKILLDMLLQSVAVRLGHELVVGDTAEIVATFFQAVEGWAGVIHDLDPAERVRAAARLQARLLQLKEFGVTVYGGIQSKPLMIEPGQSVPRPVAVLNVRMEIKPATPRQRRRGGTRS